MAVSPSLLPYIYTTKTVIMKKHTLLLLTLLCQLTFFAQHPESAKEVSYDVKPIGNKYVKKTALNKAQKLDDILESYPNSWITSYQSVEISTVNNGKTVKAIGKYSAFSPEQKNIITCADMFSDIAIDVHYMHKDIVTKVEENNIMHVVLTVHPDINAEYTTGKENLIPYIKNNSSSVVSSWLLSQKKSVKLLFTVNEAGKVENVIIKKSSGDSNIDYILMDTLYKMPKWKPAQNSDGTKVKQVFECTLNGEPNAC